MSDKAQPKLTHQIETYSVSSVLNKETKNYGKQFLFDGNDETCWNSDQGSPQYIFVKLRHEVTINSFTIQFQGGFVGRSCCFNADLASGKQLSIKFFPQDSNVAQTFPLEEPVNVKQMKFLFEDSTDFFGRIIVYKLTWQ